MSIKRYYATQNATITNAFKPDLVSRATGSNTSLADILEIFSIYAQASSSSLEASRALLQFPVTQIISDRNNNLIPASGSVGFFLKLYNAEHSETLPKNFTLLVNPLSRSFEQGNGLDLVEYSDDTRNGIGVNWINASSASAWTTPGGDYLTSSYNFTQSFDGGEEDLEINISSLVESWISGTVQNNGLGVRLTGSQENSTSRSYYIKKFFSRSSEFFFKRPIIEARWNSFVGDERGKFFTSSPLLDNSDNTHTIFLYNYVKGQLKNIANVGTGSIYVQVYTSASAGDLISTTPTVVTGGYYSTGIYTASFIMNTTSSVVYDRWFSGSVAYHTGTIFPIIYDSNDNSFESRKYVLSITNLKNSYFNNESSRLRVFSRFKNWNPNIYSVASNDIQLNIIDNVYYKLFRVSDFYDIIDYGTGSFNHTKLSYDASGSYFDFDFSLLEPGFTYGFKFLYSINGTYEENEQVFKFRVQEV